MEIYKKLSDIPKNRLEYFLKEHSKKYVIKMLSNVYGIKTSRQSLDYYLKKFKDTDNKDNVDDVLSAISSAKKYSNKKAIIDDNYSKLKDSSVSLSNTDLESVMKLRNGIFHRVLILPDSHIPYHHEGMLCWYKKLKDKYNPDLVIHDGDEVDNHAMSMHDSDPDLYSAGHELKAAIEVIQEVHDIFPTLYICDSNHGSLAFRRAKKYGIAKAYIKPYREVLFPGGGGKGWRWANEIIFNTPIEPVIVKHTLGSSDIMKNLLAYGISCVQGHYHSNASLVYHRSPTRTIFGASLGATIDAEALAFAYAKLGINKAIPVALVIIEGIPHLELMEE